MGESTNSDIIRLGWRIKRNAYKPRQYGAVEIIIISAKVFSPRSFLQAQPAASGTSVRFNSRRIRPSVYLHIRAGNLMDSNEHPKPKKELRFKPRQQKRFVPKNVVIKSEVKEDPDIAKGLEMLELFNSNLKAKKSVKFERKVEPTTLQEPYNASRIVNHRYQESSYLHTPKVKLKDYIEPWDYSSHYPVTLPLRRPYEGDPVLLDKEEFGTESTELYEQPCNAAYELGLMVEEDEPKILYMQFPRIMPVIKPVVGTETKELNEGSNPQRSHRPRQRPCGLNELPACQMGKMLVYNSGAVKLKVGDVMYDVSPGLECVFAQDLVCINDTGKDYYSVGEINKRAVVTPDFSPIVSIPQDDTR